MDDAEAIQVLTSIICADLPEEEEGEATAEVLAAVAAMYERRGRPEPEWLARARGSSEDRATTEKGN